MKKLNLFAITVLAMLSFSACEKSNVDLKEENPLARLEGFHGQQINAVKNQLKAEGFYYLDFEKATGFSKNSEQYTMYHNTSDSKTINSASYAIGLPNLGNLQAKYTEWKKVIANKNLADMKFEGRISADKFVDFNQGYTDSIKNNDTWIYVYNDAIKFELVYQTNFTKATYLSETWYRSKKNTSREYGVQISVNAKPVQNEIGRVAITNSDFTIQ